MNELFIRNVESCCERLGYVFVVTCRLSSGVTIHEQRTLSDYSRTRRLFMILSPRSLLRDEMNRKSLCQDGRAS